MTCLLAAAELHRVNLSEPDHVAGSNRREQTGLRGGAQEPFDPDRPNIARVWDHWLGGKDHFAADRELARKMLEVYPLSAQMAGMGRKPRWPAPARATGHTGAT